ncbi:MAG: hypothetical protein CL930_00290 [Deltaproteobacteria bacterium]|nr:hypothetical protein [Deltaproteobacteria bacterium]
MGMVCCQIGLALLFFASASAEEVKKPRMVTVIDRAPDSSIFLQDLDESESMIAEPGPWDTHFMETPVVAGPWSVERLGEAQVAILRDGSAREPDAPAAWIPSGEEADEQGGGGGTPWGNTASKDASAQVPVLTKQPLSDNFPLRILGHEPDALLIELPLLIVNKPSEFDGRAFWVIVEIFVDGKKVADHRQIVDKTTITTMGPTHAWVKAMVPIPSPQGQLDLRVSRLYTEGNIAEGMFVRSVRYGL